MVREQCVKTVAYKVCRMVREQCVKTVAYKVCHMVPEQRTKTIAYKVCRMVPEQCTKTITYRVCHMVKECRTKEVPYTTCRYEQRTCVKKVPYTVCKPVCYTKTIKVPHTVCKEVPYTVTRCVPRVVCTQVPVTVCCPEPCATQSSCDWMPLRSTSLRKRRTASCMDSLSRTTRRTIRPPNRKSKFSTKRDRTGRAEERRSLSKSRGTCLEDVRRNSLLATTAAQSLPRPPRLRSLQHYFALPPVSVCHGKGRHKVIQFQGFVGGLPVPNGARFSTV
jgi:hypothetical protein